MKTKFKEIIEDVHGRIAVPFIMWMLGMPLGLVILLWFFFFRGK